MANCGHPDRPHGWIDEQIMEAYGELHRLGWAHSVEAWNASGHLVGGVYGVGIGGFFAGESMFHTETDASKAALATLVSVLRRTGVTLFDVQWMTPHLRSLGATDMARSDYLRALEKAVSAQSADDHTLSEDPSLSTGTDAPIEHL
jgi:leucyl/phenylalanyl-tRNA--protein transferase